MEQKTPPLDRLIEGFAARGDHPALLQLTSGQATQLSYAQLAGEVLALAGQLQSRGLEPGDRVLIFADSGISWIRAALAVIRQRGTIVPVDVQSGLETLAHIIQTARPALALSDSDHADQLERAGWSGPLLHLDQLDDGGGRPGPWGGGGGGGGGA
ncbi:MAG: AMP-binding protein, partial [Chromatiales bacterium]|nr:AMP-binding protein [Chromatiales bacterium]